MSADRLGCSARNARVIAAFRALMTTAASEQRARIAYAEARESGDVERMRVAGAAFEREELAFNHAILDYRDLLLEDVTQRVEDDEVMELATPLTRPKTARRA